MFHSVGRILRWAKGYRRRMILGFVCSFFATWCTAGPVMLAAWALGRLIGNAWGENELSASLPWLCLGGVVVLEKGQIVDRGVQSELLSHCPLYQALWAAHVGAKTWAVTSGEKEGN